MPAQHPFGHILTTKCKIRVIQKLMQSNKRGNLLDIGCGSGFMLYRTGEMFSKSIGIDMSLEAVKFAKKYSDSMFVIGNAEKLSFEDSAFDCIISTDSFEHIPDDTAAIMEVKKSIAARWVLYYLCSLSTWHSIKYTICRLISYE